MDAWTLEYGAQKPETHIQYTNTDFSLEVGVSERGVMVALAMTADEGLLALTVASIINRLLQLQIWDTAGQERFRSITQSYYRSANALILTYDITCEDSFRCLPEWLREIEQYANNQVVTILVGKKQTFWSFENGFCKPSE